MIENADASLFVVRLFVSTNCLLMKFVVAPELMRAIICAFLPYTYNVIGILKEFFLLRATLDTLML